MLRTVNTEDEVAVFDKLCEYGDPLTWLELARKLGWLKPVKERVQKALDGLKDQKMIATAYYPFDEDDDDEDDDERRQRQRNEIVKCHETIAG
jgi:hypothetical protein